MGPVHLEGARVISVGNLSMGGTGKTPMILFLAEAMSKKYKVGVVSRGHGRSFSSKTRLVSNGESILCSPELAGDEPFLIASRLSGVLVAVAKKKARAAYELIQKHKADIILLDDGFQHYGLGRDLDIVLLDAKDPFCEQKGFLREPPESLRRADLILFTRSEGLHSEDKLRLVSLVNQRGKMKKKETDFLFSEHRSRRIVSARRLLEKSAGRKNMIRNAPSGPSGLEILRGKKIFALSGIARPGAFEDTLSDLGALGVYPIRFKDHHRYGRRSLKRIDRLTKKNDMIVTTEKDWVKLSRFTDWLGTKNLFVLEIDIKMPVKSKQKLLGRLDRLVVPAGSEG